jgi:AraC family transcriptional regulator
MFQEELGAKKWVMSTEECNRREHLATRLADAVGDATAGAGRSHQWVHQVIALLDEAVRRLREEEPAAEGAILLASSLLQKQIAPDGAQNVAVGSGRLLAWQARKVRDYIDAHIADRILVAELGAVLGQSEAHFSRTFRRTFGEPPHAFVIRRRLAYAVDYMVQTEASLSAIALRCGFSDQAHLCRAFRQATGLSPAAWRRMRRSIDQENKPISRASDNLTETRRVA